MTLFYRVKQFYWALTAELNDSDKNFIKVNLNENEFRLFNKLSLQERKHSVKVAYDVQKICNDKFKNIDVSLLLKAALLHDVGKVYTKLNILDKSLLVLGDKISKGRLKKFCNIKKIKVYYYHPKLGKELLENIEKNNELLYLVENHHNNRIKGNLNLDILRYCDKIN
ncbi:MULTISPECIES: HD domain-containing protein [Clostridium]|jgi:putative nucleotidyltransferase with HDIG domain|uniref:HD domain-containing protein n=1 Tax=Clostridium lapidicellarium TaxID=3240931 RepID=A0ABV4E095_9CLOT|nr:HD domain-containing protein [uncultured Clostridium sp.]NLU07439.1 HD domain-containing protein [Clostridiales bacterium]